MKTLLSTLFLLLAVSSAFATSPASINLQFRNGCGVTVKVFWKKPNGSEQAYLTLAHGKIANQGTYKGHKWVIREASSGLLLKTHTATRTQVVRISLRDLYGARDRAKANARRLAKQRREAAARKQAEKVARASKLATSKIRAAALAKKRAEQAAARRAAEAARRSAEAIRKRAEAARKAKAEAAARRRAAYEAKKREEAAARRRAAYEAKKREEAAARRRAAYEAKKREEAAARRRAAYEATKREEAAARRRAAYEAKKREEAAARRRAAEEAARRRSLRNKVTLSFTNKTKAKLTLRSHHGAYTELKPGASTRILCKKGAEWTVRCARTNSIVKRLTATRTRGVTVSKKEYLHALIKNGKMRRN